MGITLEAICVIGRDKANSWLDSTVTSLIQLFGYSTVLHIRQITSIHHRCLEKLNGTCSWLVGRLGGRVCLHLRYTVRQSKQDCIVHGVVTSTPGILVGISQHPHLLSCNDLCKACLLEGSL